MRTNSSSAPGTSRPTASCCAFASSAPARRSTSCCASAAKTISTTASSTPRRNSRDRPRGLTGGPRKRKWPSMNKEKNNGDTLGGITKVEDIPSVIDALREIYDESVANLRSALARYLKTGERPDPKARAEGLFAYPELRLDYRYSTVGEVPMRAFGRLNQPGLYTTSISRPHLFRKYLTEQLTFLINDYDVEVSVGRSGSEIPYPYVLDGTDDLRLDGAQAADLSLWFPSTDLSHIGDEISDGAWMQPPDMPRPLSLFDGPRVDFSLARLRHYTGTPSEHTQRYLLFTNYVRYVDEFVRWAVDELKKPNSPYRGLSAAGGVYVTKDTPDAVAAVMDGGWRRHQ